MFMIKQVKFKISLIIKILYLVLIIALLSVGSWISYFSAALIFITFTMFSSLFSLFKIRRKDFNSDIIEIIFNIVLIVFNFAIFGISSFFVISSLTYNLYPTITLIFVGLLSLINIIFYIILLANRKKYAGSAEFLTFLRHNKYTSILYVFTTIVVLSFCCFDLVFHRTDADKNYVYNYYLIALLFIGFILLCFCCVMKKTAINFIDASTLLVLGLIYIVLICFIFMNYFHYSTENNPFFEPFSNFLYILIFLNFLSIICFIPINLSIHTKLKTTKIIYLKKSNQSFKKLKIKK